MIIQIYRGDTPTITFNVTREGSAVSLTGYSMFFTGVVATAPLTGSTDYQFRIPCDVDTTNTNQCTATLSGLDSFTVGSYIAELSGNEGGINIQTYGQWELRVSMDVLQ